MSASVPTTVAIVCDSGLPEPLGGLGAYIASVQVADSLSGFSPVLVDISSFLLQHSSEIPPHCRDKTSDYSHQELQDAMSPHSAYFFVFPGHVWSHTRLLKKMISRLPRHIYANKPAAIVTYTREDTRPWSRIQANNSSGHTPRNSALMMAEHLSQLTAPEDLGLHSLPRSRSISNPSTAGRRRGFDMVQLPLGYDGQPVAWPEFAFFWDIWDSFPSNNPTWPGGSQVEAWESSGWGKCITAASIMVQTIQPSGS